jgi:transcriptional regulator with XRE-family HTH domain
MSMLEQIKRYRIEQGLKQRDMMLRVGMSRQQYQHLESKGNPRLDTLELIAKGLNSELMLIPSSRLNEVKAMLQRSVESSEPPIASIDGMFLEENELANDPWKNLLPEDD